ncbi:MAG: 4-alpha-glucanotransferase [Thermoanaerobaculia bacterium]
MTNIELTKPANRNAGILLHPTSIPGPYGIGDLGDEIVAFLDWAASAGFKWWQVLPLNPPGFGNSPYGCLSSLAGNPLLISPQRLLQDGLLAQSDLDAAPAFREDQVQFSAVAEFKFQLLRKAFHNLASHRHLDHEFHAFVKGAEQKAWLDDYALFMALKTSHQAAGWWDWEPGLAKRQHKALASARREHAEEVRFWEFTQFLFFRQWSAVRSAARARNIRILGDIPIYVAGDSADVWANRDLFQLDEDGRPTVVAGVPPDYFSKTGQRWGNPLYRWDALRETKYAWWIERIRANLRMADAVRLDHFRGFAGYWEIPAGEETAVNGRWMAAPGSELFEAVRKELGELPLVAEDLGLITQDVYDLRDELGIPGMKILQFGFTEADSVHLPHRIEPHTVVYTGTHDNDTARGWFDSASAAERRIALAYLGPDPAFSWSMIRAAYTSVAETVIVPVQDILDLGAEARMNTPGAGKDNWSWRMRPSALTPAHAKRLQFLAEISGRLEKPA